MQDEFEKKSTQLVRSDQWKGFLGIDKSSQHYVLGGVTSLVSTVHWLDEISEAEIEAVPDFVLSETLDKDIEAAVVVCAMSLKNTKYLPEMTKVGSRFGAIAEGEREGAYIENWQDFDIADDQGAPLYTNEILQASERDSLELVLSLIVYDICESGGFISEDWYHARILYEYFQEYPVSANSAYLIGELFKELCIKQQFEGDLSQYYAKLADQQRHRRKGTEATQRKANELREYCVGAFVELANNLGPRFLMAPPEVQAVELREKALKDKPNEFQRAGNFYRKEWFLRNIEDRWLEIVSALEAQKRL